MPRQSHSDWRKAMSDPITPRDREPAEPYEFFSDPEALEAVRHIAGLLFGQSSFGATPWAHDTIAVYVCGFPCDTDYEDQCQRARQAQALARHRLAEQGYEACGHAMAPDGNFGVAWVLLINAPAPLTVSLLRSLGTIAGDLWRAYYRRDPEYPV
jgi:hypothetical protein